jgi:hypothetical protein
MDIPSARRNVCSRNSLVALRPGLRRYTGGDGDDLVAPSIWGWRLPRRFAHRDDR